MKYLIALHIIVLGLVAGCGHKTNEAAANKYYEPYTISHEKDPLDHEGAGLLHISLDSPAILTKLAKYKRLKVLVLEDMNLSAADISDMEPLPMLDLLTLRHCSGLTTDAGKVFASKVITRHIQVGVGGRGAESDPGSEFLATYIQAVDVRRIDYTGEVGNLTWLGKLQDRPSVRELNVRGQVLRQEDVANVAKLSELEDLDLNYCDVSGVSSVAPLLSLKKLKTLCVSNSTGAKPALLQEVEEVRNTRPEER